MAEDRHTSEQGFGNYLSLALFGLAVVLLAGQAFVWLRSGHWPELPLWKTLQMFGGGDWHPPLEIGGWEGIEEVLSWILVAPTALVAFFTGVLVPRR
jgi:hypothetical protein